MNNKSENIVSIVIILVGALAILSTFKIVSMDAELKSIREQLSALEAIKWLK